jgi:3-oxoadipate enol-lactonase
MGRSPPETMLNCDDVGDGEPVVFVHGFPLNRRMWQAQTAAFAGTHRVIAPDLPGFGESVAGPPIAAMDGYADDLVNLLDLRNVAEPVTVCGLSMGGYVAFEFLRRHRARVARLILCDTKAAADTPEKRIDRERSAQEVLERGSEEIAQKMPSSLLGERTLAERPAVVAAVRDMIAECRREAVAAAQRGMARRADSSDLLSGIDVPTLVLCGEDDVLTPVAEMRAMAEAIPNASFAVIPLAGHLAPLENADSFNGAVRRFLEGVPPEQRSTSDRVST